jgi:hypothetical protein
MTESDEMDEPMRFSRDPTARGDEIAAYVRDWYEGHRESWWERWRKPWRLFADNFMLDLVAEVNRVQAEADRQVAEEGGERC